jgi:hypothetical protein
MELTFLDLMVVVFSAHRIWSAWLFAELFRPVREWLLNRGGMAAYFANCQFCVSVWAGIAATLLWLVGSVGQTFNIMLAVGFCIFMIESIFAKINR